MVKKITAGEFGEVQEQSVAVIDFSANWCGPCKMLAPVLEQVSEEFQGKVAFYNVDVDDNMGLAQQFSIVSIPALVVLKNGVKADLSVGFLPKDELVEFIEKQL